MKKLVLVYFASILITVTVQAQDLSKLYNSVIPTVVTISVEGKEVITDASTMSKALVSTAALGSGVVISDKGEIMTAAHVIAAADKVTVTFMNGEEVPAQVVTNNQDADVALIKLVWIPKGMKVAPLGNSDNVRIGEEVMIIGAPLGLDRSMSAGHISGRMADDISDNFTKTEFFQTDASINHGNSGGPMFNMKGEVVGIVSFILSQSGGFEGIGFAVTSNVAKNELMGKQPFWFGITFEPISGAVAQVFNLPQEMGLMVQKVAANSPAEIAGIRPGIFDMTLEGNNLLVGGDIILKVGNFDISPTMDQNAFRNEIASTQPGSSIPVKVLRGGNVIDLIVIAPVK